MTETCALSCHTRAVRICIPGRHCCHEMALAGGTCAGPELNHLSGWPERNQSKRKGCFCGLKEAKDDRWALSINKSNGDPGRETGRFWSIHRSAQV